MMKRTHQYTKRPYRPNLNASAAYLQPLKVNTESTQPKTGEPIMCSPPIRAGDSMNPWLNSAINLVVIVGGCFGLSLCSNPAYALPVQPHVGLILADHEYSAHTPRLNAVFLCVPFAYARSMVGLEGDTFECASSLSYWSANPFQPYHLNHLAVIGKASVINSGVSHD